MYTDTHVHINMKPLKYRAAELVQRAAENNVTRMITIGTCVEDSAEAVKTAEKFENVYAAIGIHPHDAKEFNYKDLGTLEKLAQNKKVLGIGEVGLDFYRDISPRKTQEEVFITMLDLALAAELPVIIHTRDADAETARVLDNMLGDSGHPVLFHCFNGAQNLLEWGMARKNVMFSFAGNVTYPKATLLHDALAQIPVERLFIETDCPYLAPIPLRGKENEPAYLIHTAKYVSAAKQMDETRFAEQLEANFKRFFRI